MLYPTLMDLEHIRMKKIITIITILYFLLHLIHQCRFSDPGFGVFLITTYGVKIFSKNYLIQIS